jgi:hypothetical protein
VKAQIMNNTLNMTSFSATLLLTFSALLGTPAHAGVAGHAQFVNGQVQIDNAAGQRHTLQKGDPVNESDTVTTASGASAQIKMEDGGLIAIRPDSQLKIDSFVFHGTADGSERSFFSLFRGGIRAITGIIGQQNKSNYRIAAGGATIGIRGTDHETFVVLKGSALAASVPPGTYNKVNSGETTLTTDKGVIHILPNQMGFAAAADQMPQLQPVNLQLFTVAPAPTQPSKAGTAVRASAVVDSAVQDATMAPANAMPKTPTLSPITIDRGQTSAPIVVVP